MTSTSDVLRACFHHHIWATLALIDALESLPADRLEAQIPGTYGSMHKTVAHLAAADGRYLLRLTGEQLPPYTDVEEPPTLDRLRAGMRDHADRWTAFLDRLDAGTLDVTLAGRPDYPETPHAEGLFLLQALHHGNDHRTQICTVLSANGFESPDLDVWSYWMERRLAPSS